MCNWFTEPTKCISQGVEDTIADSATNVLESLFEHSKSAAQTMIEWAFTWWIDMESPELVECYNENGDAVYTAADSAAATCTTGSGAIGDLQDLTGWIVGAVAIGALAIAGARMAWSGRSEHTGGLLRGLFALLAASTIGLLVVQVGLEAGDGYSSWVIRRALYDGELAGTIAVWLSALQIAGSTGVGGDAIATGVPLLIGLGIAIVAGLIGFIQFMLMLARMAALVVLAGLLPLAAAVSITEGGQATLRKYLAWMLGLLLYKPVAATIWAAAVLMMQGGTFGGGTDYLIEVMVAIMMMTLALVALPALMRLVAPAVATVGGGGGGGGLMAAGIGTGAAVASGAAQVRSTRSNATTTGTTERSRGASPPPQQGSKPGGSAPPPNTKSTTTSGGNASGGTSTNAVATGAKVASVAGAKAKGAIESGGAKAIGDGGPSGADDGRGQ